MAHKTKKMKIKFNGDTHIIEANTLINSLIHFTAVVQEVNKDLSPDKKVEINIVAQTRGSYIVDFLLKTFDAAKTLLSPDSIGYASNLASTVESVYKVAGFLKGKKPKNISSPEGGKITIENNSGTINNFDFRGASIYLNNNTIKEAITQQFATLENDNSVTGFELLDQNENPVVEIPKSDFSELAEDDIIELTKTEKIHSEKAMLNIVTVDFELKKRWDVYYNGVKIPVRITPEVFAEAINKGERFGKGDSLEVEMDIKQQLDESVNAFINKSYTVTKIIAHHQHPQQGQLNLSDETPNE